MSGESIDESAARLNGAITLTLLAVSVVTPAKWVLAYLAMDFGVKVFAGFAYSPNCHAAKWLANALRLPRRMTDASPKRFAATVGMVMSLAGFIAGYAAPQSVFLAVVLFFGLCATLESFAGFCLGCFIFGFLPEGVARVFVRRVAKGAYDG